MKIFVSFTLSFFIFTSAYASISGGKKIYLEKLREPCGFTGDKMGLMYTKKEWRYFYKSNMLNLEIKRICPESILLTRKKEVKNIYDFLSTFSKDSHNTPDCQ
jgi:hypothetical protein